MPERGRARSEPSGGTALQRRCLREIDCPPRGGAVPACSFAAGLNLKTEVRGCLLAFFEIFVWFQTNRASATGSGPQAAEPSSIFTARNSKSAKIPGVHAKARGARRAFENYGTPRVCASACAGIPLERRFSDERKASRELGNRPFPANPAAPNSVRSRVFKRERLGVTPS